MSLDDDLAAWAAAVRLPDDEADAIFRRIIATPVPVPSPAAVPGPARVAVPRLAPSWWGDFSAGFAARMIDSTRPVRRAA
ncbi:MAG TPA: hypothetical protein VFQ68_27575 [Streptosporangiaceae bacterium]|nr:hypothetical protein [Streptosporangiaceae bacterium]